MNSSQKPHDIYLAQMIEAKQRFRAAERILGAKKPLTGDVHIDNEFAFMQIRKIIELITFSAIVSDEQRYKRSREIETKANSRDKGDYTIDWNAAEILKRLSKISPHFLPIPLGAMSNLPDGTKHFDRALAKHTHDRLIELYKTVNGYAHAPNPYRENQAAIAFEKRNNARQTLQKELAWLRSVIWDHAKIGLTWVPGEDPNELGESATAWLIWFGDQSTDEIRMVLASATE
jgi:hypothetical protein